ncbi:MAG: lipopolysaccharide biosynthesis protein [Deltaproteobacteria bacterium]|nr:lipopolysaccharide biosynthesis protein [Deltaproteobacteria bacterium]
MSIAAHAKGPADIAWRSAPQVRERTVPSAAAGVLELLVSTDGGEALLARLPLGAGQVLFWAPWLDIRNARAARLEEKGANYSLRNWSYFNYWLYRIEADAAKAEPLDFHDWPGAPVPHPRTFPKILALFGGMFAVNLAAFVVVRRYSVRHPELLRQFYARASATGSGREGPRPSTGPSDGDAGGPRPSSDGAAAWETAGFRRPRAGCLYLFSVSLLFLVPGFLAVLSFNYNQVAPFPEAVGAWHIIQGLMGVFWIFLDLGTGYAFVKYFAEHRITDPGRGVMYAQLFVWWQALSGIAQVGVVALVAAGVLPQTTYAYLAWAFLLHAVIQYPGFLKLFAHLFNALQRFDLHQTMGVLTMVLAVPTNFLAVIVMRGWGARHPMFGEATGATFGLVLGGYLNELLLFTVGMGFLRGLGVKTRVLFLAHFDAAVVKSALRYGIVVAAGGAAAAAGIFGQSYLLATRLPNYPQMSGILQVSLSALVGYLFTQRFIDTLVPTISEAFAHGKKALTQYTIGETVRWSTLSTLCYGAPFVAISDLFILGVLGTQWERAAEYTRALHLWGMTQFLGLIPDSIALGAGRTRIYTGTVAAEQVVKIAVAWVLVPRIGLWGIIVASLVATLVAKIASSWWLVNRSILRVHLPWWQSVVAPVLAAAIVGTAVRLVSVAVWTPTPGRSFGLVLMALFVGTPAILFLTALFGGWDRNTLAELDDSIALTGTSRWLVKLFFRFPAWGARLSPWHGRFPVAVFAEAEREAQELTRARAAALGGAGAAGV